MSGYRPRIPFSDWYPKLKEMKVGTIFHTIRFIDKYDWYKDLETSGTIVDIWMSSAKQTIARCRIMGIAIITIYDLNEKIVHADTYKHWSINDLRKKLEKFYHSKPEWKERNSRFIMIFLEPMEITFETEWEPTFRKGD